MYDGTNTEITACPFAPARKRIGNETEDAGVFQSKKAQSMRFIKQIRSAVLSRINKARVSATRAVQESLDRTSEAERLDRIRNPSKYLGKG